MRLNLAEDHVGELGVRRFLKQNLGVVEAAFISVLHRQRVRIKLPNDGVSQIARHIAKPGKLARDILHRFRLKLLHECRCGRRVQGKQENRCLGDAR